MAVRLFFVLVLFTPFASALEYLSDGELENLDGYTSRYMLKEYDDEGNVIFRRGDNEDCRYDQSEYDDDARPKCERAFESDYDRMLASSFQRYLDQALVLMKADEQLDIAGDKTQELNLSIRLDDFDYNHFMCDGMPDKGVIRFEGVHVLGENGGDLEIRAKTRIEDTYNADTGFEERVIVSETDEINGQIGVRNIRIGTSVEDAKQAPSLGGVYLTRIPAGTIKISKKKN